MHTRDGRDWKPDYLLKINDTSCIGCGRCYKVCSRQVMALKGITHRGYVVDLDDDDAARKIMVVVDEGDCIGCGACSRVCPVDCQIHGPAVEPAESLMEQVEML